MFASVTSSLVWKQVTWRLWWSHTHLWGQKAVTEERAERATRTRSPSMVRSSDYWNMRGRVTWGDGGLHTTEISPLSSGRPRSTAGPVPVELSAPSPNLETSLQSTGRVVDWIWRDMKRIINITDRQRMQQRGQRAAEHLCLCELMTVCDDKNPIRNISNSFRQIVPTVTQTLPHTYQLLTPLKYYKVFLEIEMNSCSFSWHLTCHTSQGLIFNGRRWREEIKAVSTL